MSENFSKVVRFPEEAAKKLRQKIADMEPAAKDRSAMAAMSAAKWTAWLAAGGMQFLFWLTRTAVADNAAMRMMAKKIENSDKAGQNSFYKFMARHPDLSAHIVYYMLIAGIVGGSYIGKNINMGNFGASKTENVIDNAVRLDPKSDDFIAQCRDLENLVCIPLIYAETYRATPVVQRGENVWTHGYGMTWSRGASGKMTIRDYVKNGKNADGSVRRAHKPQAVRTKDQDLEETQQFLIDRIYPMIAKHMTRPISEGELYGLCVAGYQLEGHLPTICQQLSAANTPQQVADAFMTKTMYNYGGTPKRRWVCAMLATGAITLQDILNADIDNFYIPDQNTFIRNGHFVCDINTVQYVMGIGRKKSTRAEIGELADGKLALGQISGHKQVRVVEFDNSADGQKISESMADLIRANTEFKAGHFDQAVKLFAHAITVDPDNMEAYSSLALAYKRIGDKTQSVEYYEQCCNIVKQCVARMNANKQLLMDYDVKAAAYYNAGLAREAMAKIYAAQGKSDLAMKNYDLAHRNFKTARENCVRGGASQNRINVYDAAIQRVAKIGRNKKLAFVNGRQIIENHAHSAHNSISERA